jgi:hypothetical protein
MRTNRANARRMLTPGLKSPAGQQRSFSPVLDGFGSQKYSQIAQKIRFLKGERLGAFTPEKVNLIGRELPAKFANPAELLHIRPAASASESEASIWSAIEQVLPAGTGASPVSQAPAEPGTLRQGSLIQRVQTVPKPGQSFESFKEQVQSRASSAKPVAQPPKLPKPGDPAVRRYSRIEEVSAKETPAPPEPPAEGPAAPPPPATTVQRQPEPLVDAPSPKTDQRTPVQPAPVSEPSAAPEVQTPDQPVSASESPAAREAQIPDQPAPVSELPAAPEARTPDRPAPVSELPAAPEARTPDRPAPVSEAPAAPVVEPPARAEIPLLRALPVPKRDLPPSEPRLPKARPVPVVQPGRTEKARPASVLRAGEQVKRPTKPASRPVSSRPAVVQRQPVHPADEDVRQVAPAPESGLPAETESKPEFASLRQADIPLAAEPEQKSPPAQPAPRQPEAPLQAHLAQRRAAPQQVRFLEPRLFKPEVNRPRLIRPELRAKQASAPRERLDLPPAPPAPPTTPARQPGLPPAPTASPAIEMPVARPQELRPDSPIFTPGGAQSLTASSREAAQPPLLQPPAVSQPDQPQRVETRSPTASPAAGNVVQRLWEEHNESGSGSGGGSSAPEQGGSDGGDALDLDKIAEQVFPIVKRLIEIESERSSGYLR